jgi:energy-coupling factor transporter ATP-binding protein EcfA2
MSTIINATTTNGVVIQPDNSGSLVLQTNSGTTALTIDTSQNVGIGTTSPQSKFQVSDGSSSSNGVVRIHNPSNAGTGYGSSLLFSNLIADNVTYRTIGQISGIRENNAANYAGNLAFYTLDSANALNERMRIDSSGNVLVGTTTASGKTTILQSSNGLALNIGNENSIDGGYYGAVQITRPADPTGNAFHLAFVRNGNKIAGMGFLDNSNTFAIQNQNDNTGSGVTLTNAATSWGTTSDERKKDIVGNVENALSKISDWRTVYYKYKSDEKDAPQRVGLIAQDVQKTLSEAISIEEDELQTLQLRYTETIPVLVKAIQELTERVKALEAK